MARTGSAASVKEQAKHDFRGREGVSRKPLYVLVF